MNRRPLSAELTIPTHIHIVRSMAEIESRSRVQFVRILHTICRLMALVISHSPFIYVASMEPDFPVGVSIQLERERLI